MEFDPKIVLKSRGFEYFGKLSDSTQDYNSLGTGQQYTQPHVILLYLMLVLFYSLVSYHHSASELND